MIEIVIVKLNDARIWRRDIRKLMAEDSIILGEGISHVELALEKLN